MLSVLSRCLFGSGLESVVRLQDWCLLCGFERDFVVSKPGSSLKSSAEVILKLILHREVVVRLLLNAKDERNSTQ